MDKSPHSEGIKSGQVKKIHHVFFYKGSILFYFILFWELNPSHHQNAAYFSEAGLG